MSGALYLIQQGNHVVAMRRQEDRLVAHTVVYNVTMSVARKILSNRRYVTS